MPNHFHVILFVDRESGKQASTLDIVTHWHQIHQGNIVCAKFLKKETLEPHELDQLNTFIGIWRERLCTRPDLINKAGFKVSQANTGAVILIQRRFGSALNLNLHFHVLFITGVFSPKSNGQLRFHRVNAPTSKEFDALVATIQNVLSEPCGEKLFR